YDTMAVAPSQPVLPTETATSADLPAEDLEPTLYPDSSAPQSGATSETPQPGQLVAPTAAVVHPPLEPTMPVKQKGRRLSRISATLLIGLVVVIIVGGILGSVSLFTHFSIIGTHSSGSAIKPVRGGTW